MFLFFFLGSIEGTFHHSYANLPKTILYSTLLKEDVQEVDKFLCEGRCCAYPFAPTIWKRRGRIFGQTLWDESVVLLGTPFQNMVRTQKMEKFYAHIHHPPKMRKKDEPSSMHVQFSY
jgi:hypothetical protein